MWNQNTANLFLYTIQTTGAGMGVTTTAGLSEPSDSYFTLPKDEAIRASPAHSLGRLVLPQRPSTTRISATFQGEDGDIVETGQPGDTALPVSTVSTVTPVMPNPSTAQVEPTVTMTSPQKEVTSPA